MINLTVDPGYTPGIASNTCGGALVGTTFTSGPITGACSVSFNSSINSYTVTASGDAQVTPAPLSQSVDYNDTAVINLTVTPGYTAGIASNTCGGALVGTTFTSGPITGACAVSFNSTINSYTVTASGDAQVTPAPLSQSVDYNNTAVINLTVDPGNTPGIASNTCGGSLVGTTFTSGPITSACAVSFNSTIISYTVTASGDAQVTPAPLSQSVNYNDTAVINLTVTPGYSASIASNTCGGSLVGTTFTSGAITSACAVSFNSTFVPNNISVAGSPLLLPPNSSGTLTITNNGATTAQNVMATLPAGLAANVLQDATNCSSITAGGICYLKFTSNAQAYPDTVVSISGTNTTSVNATITLGLAYVTNADVYAIKYDSTSNLIRTHRGAFTVIGPNLGGGVPTDASSGTPATLFPRVDGNVNTVISDGNDGWYIGGAFATVGTVTRNNIAHILADGTVDATFNPNANNPVFSIALSGSLLYMCGNFTTVSGQSRTRLAAVDASTGIPTSWNPTANNQVNTIAVSGSTVYVGGIFTSTGGQLRNRIAALDTATNNATAWNPNANDVVREIAVSGSTIYVGGRFTTIGTNQLTRNRIAALDASTGDATTWNPNASSDIYSIVISGNTIYVGGLFLSIGGASRNRIAALDATSGNATAWDPNVNSPVYKIIALSGNTIYAGGDFTTAGSTPVTRNRLAAFDINTNTNNATTWNPNANERAAALASSTSAVYVGGLFTSLGGQTRSRIAALDASTGAPTAGTQTPLVGR